MKLSGKSMQMTELEEEEELEEELASLWTWGNTKEVEDFGGKARMFRFSAASECFMKT